MPHSRKNSDKPFVENSVRKIIEENNKLDIKQQNLSKGTFNTVKATNKLMDKLNIDSWDISIKEVKNKYKELKNDNR